MLQLYDEQVFIKLIVTQSLDYDPERGAQRVYKPPPTKNGGTSIGAHGVHLPTDCIYLVPEQLQWPLPVQNSQIIQLLKAASGPRLSRWWDLRSVQEKVHPMLSFRLENRCQPIVVCGSARNGSNRRSVNLHLQVCIYNAWCRHECRRRQKQVQALLLAADLHDDQIWPRAQSHCRNPACSCRSPGWTLRNDYFDII